MSGREEVVREKGAKDKSMTALPCALAASLLFFDLAAVANSS